MVHAEAEAFEDGQGKHKEFEVVEDILEVPVHKYLCNRFLSFLLVSNPICFHQ